MKNLFERASSYWVRYDRYELKEGKNGVQYVTAAPDAKPEVYNPLENPERLVLYALNVGLLSMGRKSEKVIRQGVMDFVHKYGLLGFMTALPTTPQFMEYEAVYLPKNQYIREESMPTEKYLELFYPFDKLDLVKKGIESSWNINEDRTMQALALTFSEQPMAMNMSFQRQYAERYDWLAAQFKDWAFHLLTSFFYYEDNAFLKDEAKKALHMSMAAFGGMAPTYHIALFDKPTIVWDFHSLLLGIQMMFSFMLTDEDNPLKLCKHCQKVFAASRQSNLFCSPKCKNQYNVYKSRKKNKEQE